MFDLTNIFDIFLPQLLMYPNPKDPLNPEAALLQLKFKEKYIKKIKVLVEKYAKRASTRKMSYLEKEDLQRKNSTNSNANGSQKKLFSMSQKKIEVEEEETKEDKEEVLSELSNEEISH